MILSDCSCGQIVKIKDIVCNSNLKRRLFELGFIKNAVVEIIDISSFRHAFLIRLHNSLLALRKYIAKTIEVSQCV